MLKVSVIIPCYNSERFLTECMDSVLGQTLQDIEIICVDDGSTDRTPDILHEYAKKDERIRVLIQKNQYTGVARNNGMDIAAGKYLAFLDSDDFFEPVMLEKMYEKCEEDEADICVCGHVVYDMSTGRISGISRPNLHVLPSNVPFSARDIPKHIFNFCNPGPCSKLFRAEFVKKHSLKYPSLKQSEDALFTRSALAVAERITVIDQCFAVYRKGTATSLTEANTDSTLCLHEAAKGLKDFLIQRGLFHEFEESFAKAVLSGAVFYLRMAKSKERWLNTALFLKNKFIPDFGLWNYPESIYINQQEYETMSFLMKSSPNKLEGHEPQLRQDETTTREFDAARSFPLDDSLKVSVIIPVYNTEKYVEECIRSVMRQTLRDIEIICVDDGSTDNSPQIINRIAEEDGRIIVLRHKENQGQSSARNTALDAARGKYIYFMDSDDLLVWRALEHIYRQAEYHSLDDISFEAASFYDPVGLYQAHPQYYGMYRYSYKGSYPQPVTGRDLLDAMIQCGDYKSTVCCRLFRRKFLEDNRIRFPVGIIHEDDVFTIRALNAAKRAWVYKEPLYFRRVREESTMTQVRSWENVYGYYVCLLEIEQMIMREESKFKSTLEKLRRRYRDDILRMYRSIPEKERSTFPAKLKFSSDVQTLAALPLLIKRVERKNALRKIVNLLANLLCIFVPVRRWRHYIRDSIDSWIF